MPVTVIAHPSGSLQWVEGTYTQDDIDAANAASANGTFADWAAANAVDSETALPVVVPGPPPLSPQEQARQVVGLMAASIPSQIAQAQADVQTLSTLAAGRPLTADHVAVLQRSQAGWTSLLQGLQALFVSLPVP